MYTLLIDNGHGIDTAGKRSPLLEDGKTRLYEWRFTRDVANHIVEFAKMYGLRTHILVPEERDIPLSERAHRANEYIRIHPREKCILVSIHGNALGSGEQWMSARGWEAWTTVGQNNSDKFAELLYKYAEQCLPNGTKIRRDGSDGDSDKEKNFTVPYMAKCPAVLTENLFYDNREECAYMMSDYGQRAIARLHVLAAVEFFKSLR